MDESSSQFTISCFSRTWREATLRSGGRGDLADVAQLMSHSPFFDELATSNSALRTLLWWVTSILTFYLVYSNGVRGALTRNGLTFLFAVSFLGESHAREFCPTAFPPRCLSPQHWLCCTEISASEFRNTPEWRPNSGRVADWVAAWHLGVSGRRRRDWGESWCSNTGLEGHRR